MVNFVIIFIISFVIFISFKIMNEENEKKWNIHTLYIIGILVSIIILLVTQNFGSNKNLVNYVSFAATLSSLILAVLAIIQAMISQTSFGNTFEKINNASDELSVKSALLDNAADKILQGMKSMEQKMKKIHSDVGVVKKQQESISNQKPNTAKPVLDNGTGRLSDGVNDNMLDKKKLFDYFLSNASPAGLLVLYAIKISKEKAAQFNLKTMTDVIISVDYDYAYGFLVATSSWGIISFEIKDNVVNVFRINDYINDNLYKKLIAVAEDFDVKYPSTFKMVDEIKKIEEFI
jgi:hypothetical protein